MIEELSVIELAWLIISLVGLVFALLNLAAARSDVVAARLVFNFRRDTRLVLADGAVQRNWIRVAVFLWWLLLGLTYGLFDPPEVPRLAGTLGLIVTAAGLAYTGIQEATERREVADLLSADIADELEESHNVDLRDAEVALGEREVAAEVASSRHDEMRESMNATATNTERIADNTDPNNGG